MVGMLSDIPQLLSGSGVDKAYSALVVPYFHAEENLESGIVRIDVGYDRLVGMAYACAPEGLAVVAWARIAGFSWSPFHSQRSWSFPSWNW